MADILNDAIEAGWRFQIFGAGTLVLIPPANSPFTKWDTKYKTIKAHYPNWIEFAVNEHRIENEAQQAIGKVQTSKATNQKRRAGAISLHTKTEK